MAVGEMGDWSWVVGETGSKNDSHSGGELGAMMMMTFCPSSDTTLVV